MIHPCAIVDAHNVPSTTSVWHFSHIREGAVIGHHCMFAQNVYVAPTVVVGNHCRIQNNVSLFDGVTLDDYVFIGPSVVFTNVLRPRAFINQHHLFLPTTVGTGASIGANATILCGNSIGPFSLIAAGSVVTHDVPPFALVCGNPARLVAWICYCATTLYDIALHAETSSLPAHCPTCNSSVTWDSHQLPPHITPSHQLLASLPDDLSHFIRQ